MAAFVVLPCPLENRSQIWAAPVAKVGGWFGANSTLVQILWMISSGMLFHFQEKLCFTAKDTCSHHAAVPCMKYSDFCGHLPLKGRTCASAQGPATPIVSEEPPPLTHTEFQIFAVKLQDTPKRTPKK